MTVFRRRKSDMTPPRVEVLHWRDRDNGDEHVVFIDGVEVSAHIYTIYPGRGWTRREWEIETEVQVSDASPEVAFFLREARNDAADNSDDVKGES